MSSFAAFRRFHTKIRASCRQGYHNQVELKTHRHELGANPVAQNRSIDFLILDFRIIFFSNIANVVVLMKPFQLLNLDRKWTSYAPL